MPKRHRDCVKCEWFSQENAGGFCHYYPGYTSISDDWWCREWQNKDGIKFGKVDKEGIDSDNTAIS